MKNTPDDPKTIQPVPRAAENKICWSMPAASGRARIDCALLARSEKSDALVCQVNVIGEFWPRGRIEPGTDTTNDFHVALPQVLVDFKSLKSLRERLVEWQVNPSDFSVALGVQGEGDQRLTLAIGHDDNLIYSAGKPACMFTYACGSAMQGRWSFVVDQSCIRLCAEDIGKFVRALEATQDQS